MADGEATGGAAQTDVALAAPPASAYSAHHLVRTGDLSLLVARGTLLAAVDRVTSLTTAVRRLRAVERASAASSAHAGAACRGTGGGRAGRWAPWPPRGPRRLNPYATLTVRVPERQLRLHPEALRRSWARCESVSTSSEDVTSAVRGPAGAPAALSRAVEARLVALPRPGRHHQRDAGGAGPHRQGPAAPSSSSAPQLKSLQRDDHVRHPLRLPEREGLRPVVGEHVGHLLGHPGTPSCCSAAALASPASPSPPLLPFVRRVRRCGALVAWYAVRRVRRARGRRGAAVAALSRAAEAARPGGAAVRPRVASRSRDSEPTDDDHVRRRRDEGGAHPRVRRPRGPGATRRYPTPEPQARPGARARRGRHGEPHRRRRPREPLPHPQGPAQDHRDGRRRRRRARRRGRHRGQARRRRCSSAASAWAARAATPSTPSSTRRRPCPSRRRSRSIDAAALGLVFPTAYYALVRRAAPCSPARPCWCRAPPAASARRRCSSPSRSAPAWSPPWPARRRRNWCARLGAEDVIDYRAEDVVARGLGAHRAARASTSSTSS